MRGNLGFIVFKAPDQPTRISGRNNT